MKKHLIPMTDFVLEHPASTDYEWQLSNHLRYANFLKQTKQLWMFVPCDENGNVLYYSKTNYEEICDSINLCRVISKEESKYLKAKQKVLFEGFEVIKESKNHFILKNKNEITILDLYIDKTETLETLQYANLELTETGFKYFYVC